MERHLPLQKKRVESRTVDRVEKRAGVWRVEVMGFESLSRRRSSTVLLLSSLLSIFLGLPAQKKSVNAIMFGLNYCAVGGLVVSE